MVVFVVLKKIRERDNYYVFLLLVIVLFYLCIYLCIVLCVCVWSHS